MSTASFSLLLCFLCFFSSLNSQSDELQVLLNVKTAFQKSNTNVFNSWVSSNSICNFAGITCNSGNSVTEIELSYQNLVGVVPLDSICKLPSLEKLSLGFNSLSGSISDDLNKCTNLRYLDLGNNLFSGHFPEFSSLSQLQHLFLNLTGLSGVFPWKSLENITGLVTLSLGDNPFYPTPFPLEIVKLTKLNWLYLSNCSIGLLKNLWQLELYKNSLTGKLPVEIGNLTKLEKFDASMNYLEGGLSELRFLTNLVTLQLFENELSGEIPMEFGQFKKLVRFHPDMCKQGTMEALLMLQNNFTGEIPASYGSCTTLKRFRVSKNSLSGTVPAGIWGLPIMNIIDIEFNQFEGPVTSDIRNAKALGQLFLGYNRLSGELPGEISGATSLVSIKLNDNQFSGKIPETIGELKHLSSLHLENNMFSGSIPESLGSCDSLSDLNIAHNLLSGEIPSSIGSLPTLNSLNLSENQLSGQIPDTLSSLSLSLLDLTHNRLTGRIPQSLSIEAYNGSFAGNSGLCSQTVSTFQLCKPEAGMSKDVRTLIACFGVGAAILVLSLVYFLYLKKKEKDHERSLKEESWDVKSFHVLGFGEDEILDSIKEENLIGKGGSGNVYKVALANGKELAVKHILNTDSCGRKKSWSTTPMLARRGGKSKEFDAEVHTLSSTRHVNVVKLYCSITSEDSSLLVYEYMPNEYGYTYKVSEKSDVYSFGVVLMELVSGKRPIEPEFGDNKDIVDWVSSNLKSKERVLSIVDSRIPEFFKEDVVKVLRIAILCTERLPSLRPTMRSVVQMLREAEPCKLAGIVISKDGASKRKEVTDKGKFSPGV
ncbi:hypothetical protein GH714_008510 [Hevea brasiliensis]|uniref:non-specific serine/threonine protein kinase n=1 Tax=Hevea brasiliensis TaxID=3981 RepID=A0A6A6NG69_HEVBR|nr:hypothetical protein GH714_008510 [Hevea brasiliensis]